MPLYMGGGAEVAFRFRNLETRLGSKIKDALAPAEYNEIRVISIFKEPLGLWLIDDDQSVWQGQGHCAKNII